MKKTTKKLIVSLMSVSAVMSVLGSSIAVNAEDISGKVEFWNDKLANEEASVSEAITQSVVETSGVDFVINSYADVAAFQTAFQQSIREPEAPGLFTWWSGEQLKTLVDEGVVEDLTDIWEEYLIPAGVSESIAESFTYDGKIYGVPYGNYYHAVFYNKDCFEKAGIAETPETFEEFLEDCEKLKEAGITPIGLKNDSWASFYWFSQLIAGYDHQLYNDICSGAKDYTDPSVKEVMGIWRDMIDKGYFADPVAYADLKRDFATGKSAMYLELSNEPVYLAKEYGMVSGEDFGQFALPSINNSEKKPIFFVSVPICVASASEDKGTAKKVLGTWFDSEVQNIFTREFGLANTTTIEIEDPTISEIVNDTTDSDNYVMLLRYYENTPAEIRDFACDELSRFMYSGADIDEVLEKIQGKAEEVFNK